MMKLKTYKAEVVIFPQCAGKFKAGNSAPKELAIVSQVHIDLLPIIGEQPSRDSSRDDGIQGLCKDSSRENELASI